jgi:hypothetical protein
MIPFQMLEPRVFIIRRKNAFGTSKATISYKRKAQFNE